MPRWTLTVSGYSTAAEQPRRQVTSWPTPAALSLIHIWRCRRYTLC